MPASEVGRKKKNFASSSGVQKIVDADLHRIERSQIIDRSVEAVAERAKHAVRLVILLRVQCTLYMTSWSVGSGRSGFCW